MRHPGTVARLAEAREATARLQQLTSRKEKSGQASAGASPSVPSADSTSVLERSRLALLWPREESCGSVVEAGSVWEENDDRRLLGGCLRAEPTWLSEEGDSAAKLQG